jgi:exodeoxyribonuclease V alpha subunit
MDKTMLLPMTEQMIVGRFAQVYFEKEDFKIVAFTVRSKVGLPCELADKLQMTNKPIRVTCKGYSIPTVDGMEYNLFGKWNYDKAHGYSMDVTYASIKNPETDTALKNYLCSSLFPGIGRKKATTLVEAYHGKVFEMVEQKPEEVAKLQGFNEKIVSKLAKCYETNKVYTQLANYLMPYGITAAGVAKISKTYGKKALRVVQHNPYTLLNSVKGISLSDCDKIAVREGIALNSSERIEAVIFKMIKRMCSEEGGMYVDSKAMYARVERELNANIYTLPTAVVCTKADIGMAYLHMKSEGVIVQRTLELKNEVTGNVTKAVGIFTKEYDDCERKVSDKLIKLSEKEIDFNAEDVEKYIDEYNGKQKFPLHPTQIEAVRNSIMNNCSIITGGPGTGKTTILRCILYVWRKLTSAQITCMAPTGKASQRMKESTKMNATTIHKRLKLFQGDVINAKPETIDSGLVVLDEMSMVDNVVMNKLMEAVNEECHIIMVGDIDQLPSVGSGAVLEQMIGSGAITYTKLTKTFRQDPNNGGGIITNALKINKGDSRLEYDEHFQMVDAKTEQEAIEKITTLYTEQVQKWGIDNVALLSPLRSTQSGRHMCASEGLNPILQNLCNPMKDGMDSVRYAGTEYRTNDRVMKKENGEKSSNGDIGVITRIYVNEDDETIVVVDWETGEQENFTRIELDKLTLAYSMSIHKSQGSEYDCVIIPVLSSQKCPLFKRNLLYTGVTRAKKQVILVGDQQAVNTMCAAADNHIRNTVLGTRLRMKSKKKAK